MKLDPAKVSSQIEVMRKPVTPNLENSPWLWSDAPTTLTVSAHKLDGWDYEINPNEPHQRFTPHLPAPAKVKPSPNIERLTLVPFGATQLRISIFPQLKS
ncbi:MAG TPA: hypothetical protein VFB43_19050 [Terracidiphilus sp.]|nr:hypothetical protein [Terracidiphilus sp.]